MDVLDKVLEKLDPNHINPSQVIWSHQALTELFRLHDQSGDLVFIIKVDGTVEIGPNYVAKTATDQFWHWIANGTNLVQLAVEQAKREERERAAEILENHGALALADLIRN